MSKRGEWLRRQKAIKKKRVDLAETDRLRAKAIYEDLFEQQKLVVDDIRDSRWGRQHAVLTPRRSGKTHTAGSAAFITALSNPGCIVVIVCLSRLTARQLYWDDIFCKFDDQYGLGLSFNVTRLTVTLENGSVIRLCGAETIKEAEKLRGGKYQLVIIDECKSFNPDVFTELVDEIVIPATLDSQGNLLLIGTPGAILSGPFYEATYENFRTASGHPISRDYYNPDPYWENPNVRPEWSFHHWTSRDNVKVPHLWQEALDKKKAKRWSDDNPKWTREYLGKWVSTRDAMVFAYNSICETDGGAYHARCTYSPDQESKYGLPPDETWRFVMGIDLGFEDDFALVVAAYSEHRDCLYLVEDFKAPHLIISDVAEVIQRYTEKYDIEAMVADTGGSAKQIVESLNQMYGFHFEKAEKKDKPDFIELLNSDLYDGKIKIPLDSNLAQEWKTLQWKLGAKTKGELVRYGKLEVDRRFDDHCSDAFLYLWRLSLHHFSRERSRTLEPQTQEWYDEQDRLDAEAAVARRDRQVAIDSGYDDGNWIDDELGLDDSWLSTDWLH